MKNHPALETLLLPLISGGLPFREPALFLGALPHPFFEGREIIGWQPSKPAAEAWECAGYPLAPDIPQGRFPLVLVLPGKSRDETLHCLAMAEDRLAEGGILVCAMPNTAGAARFSAELANAAGGVTSDSKHKCRVFHATKHGPWNRGILDCWRALGGKKSVPGTHFLTEAGVFSHGRIDAGSQFLANHLPANLRGRVADLGAGWGFLSDAVFRRCPGVEIIDLYEADARALDCARHNLADFPAARFHWSDVTTGLPEMYDAILMNPPFHTGQMMDVGLGRDFLTTAHAALRRGGRLLFVANRQLPYEAVLDTLGFHWRKTAEDGVYKLFSAVKR